MTLLHPLWMSALLPWAALAVYVLRRGASRRVPIPFLQLWRSDRLSDRSATPQVWAWPLTVLLGLVAMMLAILAGADPARTGPLDAVTVIIDRGLTMSLRGAATAHLIGAVDQRIHAGKLRVVFVPGVTIETDGRHWAALAEQAGPTAVDTAQTVKQAVASALARDSAPVIVISDASIPADPRLFQVAPAKPLTNDGIDRFAVTGGDAPQAMVRMHGAATGSRATLTVTGGAKPVSQRVELPPAGGAVDVFVELPPPLGNTVTATLATPATSPLNDHAAAVRTSSGPLRWMAAGPVPAVVTRLIEVYGQLRPADNAASPAVVRMDTGDYDGTGIWLVAQRGTSIGSLPSAVVLPGKITAEIRDWPAPADDAAPAPAGWRTLVRRGDVPILAERSDDRAFWLNGDLEQWAHSPSFVVFLAGAFDAIADGSAEWSAEAPHRLAPGWQIDGAMPAGVAPGEWPGIYTDGSRRIAINAGPIVGADRPLATDDLTKLERSGSVAAAGVQSARPYLAATAGIIILLALVLQKAER